MREVDTDALLSVAPSLGVGNPATATRQVVFDDENLQQVWDATKFGRFPRLTGVFSETFNPGVNATARNTLSRNALFDAAQATEYADRLEELGLLDPAAASVYFLGIQITTPQSTAANVDEVSAGIRLPIQNTLSPTPLIVSWGTTFDGTTPLVANGELSLRSDFEPPDDGFKPPVELITGDAGDSDVLFMMGDTNAGGGSILRFLWYLHFCLKDMPLWYWPR